MTETTAHDWQEECEEEPSIQDAEEIFKAYADSQREDKETNEYAAFMHQIVLHPDKDGPRLKYADYCDERGDPRGTFIRLQCALAKMCPDDPRRVAMEKSEAELLECFGHLWTPDFLDGVQFRRGFVSIASIGIGTALQHAAILKRDPIGTLVLKPRIVQLRLPLANEDGEAINKDSFQTLECLPVRTLCIENVNSDAQILLQQSQPYIQELDFSNDDHMTEYFLHFIAENDSFTSLHTIDLSGATVSRHQLSTLCINLPSLKRIHLADTFLPAEDYRILKQYFPHIIFDDMPRDLPEEFREEWNSLTPDQLDDETPTDIQEMVDEALEEMSTWVPDALYELGVEIHDVPGRDYSTSGEEDD